MRAGFGWFHKIGTDSLFLISLLSLCNVFINYVFGVSNGIKHIAIGYIYLELQCKEYEKRLFSF